MSRPLPIDLEARAREKQRQKDLAESEPVQRGRAQAREQALANVRNEVHARLADLKRTTLNRDLNMPSRNSYNRGHGLLVKAAERLAEMSGEHVSIPAWLPPPSAADVPMVTIGKPQPPVEKVVTRKDPGVPLTSLPVFGSRMDAMLRSAGVVK
jgi:hypothetical protein